MHLSLKVPEPASVSHQAVAPRWPHWEDKSEHPQPDRLVANGFCAASRRGVHKQERHERSHQPRQRNCHERYTTSDL